MKKIIATALILFTFVSCFTACKKESDDDETTTLKTVEIGDTTSADDGSSSDTTTTKGAEVIDFNTTRVPEEPTTIKPKKTVTLNLPYALVKEDAGDDLKQYAATYGYRLTEEKDGTVTLKMDGMAYSFMLSRIGMKVIKSIGEIVDLGAYPYLIELADYNQDFSYLLFKVNAKKYKKVKDDMPYEELAYIIGQSGLCYQYFTVEEENKCEVVFADSKSGKVVYREVYTDINTIKEVR